MQLKLLLVLFFSLDFQKGASAVKYVRHTFNILVKKLEGVIEETVVNTECGRDLKLLIHDLIRWKKWAVQMVDASAKIEPGILAGNVNHMGNYDECLSVKEVTFNGTIRGQYCTVILSPKTGQQLELKGIFDPLWFANFVSSKAVNFLKKNLSFMKMSFGLCVPSSCSPENLRSVSRYVEYTVPTGAHFDFEDMLCQYENKPVFYIGIEPLIFFGFGVYFLILISATIYDIFFYNKDEESLSSYICTFSIKENARKLFSTKVGEDNLPCINGLKVLSMLWVLIGHRFFVNAMTPNVNSLYLFEWKENIESMMIVGGTVSVDTFLAISGLLLSYIYLKYTQIKNIKVNISSFYMLRLFRLLPPMIAMILIYITVLKYINDGPLWSALSFKLSVDCLFYGWTNVLFVNNFMEITKQCLPQSWYLSVDSQLYFMFPLIFFSIAKYPRRTLLVIFFIGVLSTISSFLVTVFYGYNFIIFDVRYWNDIYQSTFLRMPVWLIGVTTGYLIFKYKNEEVKIRKDINISLWITAILLLNFIIFGQILLTRNENNVMYSAFFNAFARPLWALSICWIIFACVTKNGGFLNDFLSWSVFSFFAKINYSLFLVHFAVIILITGRRRHIDHFSNVRAIHEFCGDAIFSTVVGIIFSILFESPFITFGRKVFRKYEILMTEHSEKTVVVKYKLWIFPFPVYEHNKIE